VAVRVAFSDQSQLSYHFKRIFGVTPGQLWGLRKNHLKEAASAKTLGGNLFSVLLK
jgi:AraC-like DNA-binding protein